MPDIQIDLISKSYNEQTRQTTESKKTVFATKESIMQNEFFAAYQSGLKPQFVLKIWDYEYSGEEYVEMDEKRYRVYRTFTRTQEEKIELYCEEKPGVKAAGGA